VLRDLLVIASLFALWTASSSARTGFQPLPVPGEAPFAAANDTIRTVVQAGEALVITLPDEVRGREARYRVLRAPALSWLVDRSFYWRTLPAERGLLYVLFERTVDGREPDTLALAVEIVGG